MTLSILIPVRSFAHGKTRLSPVLSPMERAALGRDFLRHVLGVALHPTLGAQVHVISPDADVLDLASEQGATVHRDGADGHNSALDHRLARLPADRPVLVLNVDLPLLRVEDILAMRTEARTADIVLATDHAGQGTNALWLARPGLIPMAFGPGSRAAHERAAQLAGLTLAFIARHGLAQDIDLPDDLAFLPARA